MGAQACNWWCLVVESSPPPLFRQECKIWGSDQQRQGARGIPSGAPDPQAHKARQHVGPVLAGPPTSTKGHHPQPHTLNPALQPPLPTPPSFFVHHRILTALHSLSVFLPHLSNTEHTYNADTPRHHPDRPSLRGRQPTPPRRPPEGYIHPDSRFQTHSRVSSGQRPLATIHHGCARNRRPLQGRQIPHLPQRRASREDVQRDIHRNPL